MASNGCDPSQLAFDFAERSCKRSRERGGIFTAAFGHIRPASALSAHGLRDAAHEFAGLNLAA